MAYPKAVGRERRTLQESEPALLLWTTPYTHDVTDGDDGARPERAGSEPRPPALTSAEAEVKVQGAVPAARRAERAAAQAARAKRAGWNKPPPTPPTRVAGTIIEPPDVGLGLPMLVRKMYK